MPDYIGNYRGYDIYISKKYPKKYYAMVNNKKVYFGDIRYEQFRDKMGHYTDLNHFDTKRRTNYKRRHEYDRHKVASAGWFADQVLW